MDSVAIMGLIQDKLPKDTLLLAQLTACLDKLDDDGRKRFFNKLAVADLLSPEYVFWLGAFAFGYYGVGRLMIGDMAQGFIRLTLGILSVVFLFLFLALLGGTGELSAGLLIPIALALLCMIVAGVLSLADLFLIGRRVRMKNYQKVLSLYQQG